jgi:hypothetical protein
LRGPNGGVRNSIIIIIFGLFTFGSRVIIFGIYIRRISPWLKGLWRGGCCWSGGYRRGTCCMQIAKVK